eukprot:scaffold166461_cov43-Prasinocladus_malaysianus.AAC.1
MLDRCLGLSEDVLRGREGPVARSREDLGPGEHPHEGVASDSEEPPERHGGHDEGKVGRLHQQEVLFGDAVQQKVVHRRDEPQKVVGGHQQHHYAEEGQL